MKASNKAQRWLSVGILCYINLINYMDRYTVAGVLADIEETWPHVQDDEKGLIQTSFIICYFASAPIFGFLGDRFSRKWLMAIGILAWGVCTLISSFMKDFVAFLLFRAAIGFGEAGFTSIAPTVLGDLFTGSLRTIVLALFYFAIPVGSGLGYLVGTKVTEAADGDWRWGVRVTPFLNILALILLIFFMLDPPRGDHDTNKSADEDKQEQMKREKNLGAQLASWKDDLIYLLMNKSYMLSTAAFTCLTFCTGALSWFGPLFVEKALKVRQDYHLEGFQDDISISDIGFIFGGILSVAGICGLLLGSGLSLWLRPRIAWIDPVICGCGLLVSAPLIFAALYIIDESVILAFVLMFIGQVFLNMNWAVVVDISLYVVIPIRRSSAEAFQLMASHALGEAGSPYLTGLISEEAFKDHLGNATSHYNVTVAMTDNEKDFVSMQKALYFSLGFEVLGAILFLLTALFVVSDKTKAEEAERLEAAAASKTAAASSSENLR